MSLLLIVAGYRIVRLLLVVSGRVVVEVMSFAELTSRKRGISVIVTNRERTHHNGCNVHIPYKSLYTLPHLTKILHTSCPITIHIQP
jgi:hypothetical protein